MCTKLTPFQYFDYNSCHTVENFTKLNSLENILNEFPQKKKERVA